MNIKSKTLISAMLVWSLGSSHLFGSAWIAETAVNPAYPSAASGGKLDHALRTMIDNQNVGNFSYFQEMLTGDHHIARTKKRLFYCASICPLPQSIPIDATLITLPDIQNEMTLYENIIPSHITDIECRYAYRSTDKSILAVIKLIGKEKDVLEDSGQTEEASDPDSMSITNED